MERRIDKDLGKEKSCVLRMGPYTRSLLDNVMLDVRRVKTTSTGDGLKKHVSYFTIFLTLLFYEQEHDVKNIPPLQRLEF